MGEKGMEKNTVSDEEIRSAIHRYVREAIWRNANIEIAVTFPDTEAVLDGQLPDDLTLDDGIVINNIKRAWAYLEKNWRAGVDFDLASQYNAILGGGLVLGAGELRTGESWITGTDYRPKISTKEDVLSDFSVIEEIKNPIDRALIYFSEICRSQFFNDGNKRTAQMIANHVLIQNGKGFLGLRPDLAHMKEFRSRLISFYESGDSTQLRDFLKKTAIMDFKTGLTQEQEESKSLAATGESLKSRIQKMKLEEK
ncbi:Fic family protein [Lactovum odontotermitis]